MAEAHAFGSKSCAVLRDLLKEPGEQPFLPHTAMKRLFALLSSVTALAACSSQSAAPPARAPAPEPQVTAEVPAPEQEMAQAPEEEMQMAKEPERPLAKVLPTTCEPGPVCVPPVAFAKAACKGRYPDMAIAMFEKTTPWQRLYLKAESIEAVNAYGSRDTPEPIVFGEEVLLLRTAQGSMTSSADIDVLRWDGSCATVSREMFVERQMREVYNAPIDWKQLDGYIRQALLKSKYVKLTYEAQKVACQDSRFGPPSPPCEKANRRLNDAITVAVRGGTKLPVPEKLPAWAPIEMAPEAVASNSNSLAPF